jgi:hypothetical protein
MKLEDVVNVRRRDLEVPEMRHAPARGSGIGENAVSKTVGTFYKGGR